MFVLNIVWFKCACRFKKKKLVFAWQTHSTYSGEDWGACISNKFAVQTLNKDYNEVNVLMMFSLNVFPLMKQIEFREFWNMCVEIPVFCMKSSSLPEVQSVAV